MKLNREIFFILGMLATFVSDTSSTAGHFESQMVIMDTEAGFCESDEFGRIPVGNDVHLTDECGLVVCFQGYLTVARCGDLLEPPPGCRNETAVFPDCCTGTRLCPGTPGSEGSANRDTSLPASR
ncbi:hypothetical protein AVEN_267296-1 [Araneus ventricosus]|uniref:Single domain-containing protein n=1 Tax=Araneus ventricosus TaxID=182803 RepID=A0A4Y2DM62_ARAVE|nr:hypothetical protein AVEN_267296-1 [Araneus ventricosus]